jgi:hypothetical protein
MSYHCWKNTVQNYYPSVMGLLFSIIKPQKDNYVKLAYCLARRRMKRLLRLWRTVMWSFWEPKQPPQWTSSVLRPVLSRKIQVYDLADSYKWYRGQQMQRGTGIQVWHLKRTSLD